MPAGYPGVLTALDYQLGPRREIVIAAGYHDGEAELFVNEEYKKYSPRTFVAFCQSGDNGQLLEIVAPFVKNKPALNGKATFYICENNTCRLSVTTFNVVRRMFM